MVEEIMLLQFLISALIIVPAAPCHKTIYLSQTGGELGNDTPSYFHAYLSLPNDFNYKEVHITIG